MRGATGKRGHRPTGEALRRRSAACLGGLAILPWLGSGDAAIAQDEPEFAAEDTALEDVDFTELDLAALMDIQVYSASRGLQSSLEAPSSVSILTAEDIEAHGWRTLADLLRSVRSFQVSDDRNYEHLGVRGFSPPGDFNSRVLLLVDGHRLNNNLYGTAPIGLDLPLDVDLIERVEVIRGAGSSLYGSNAFFGVVHVITKEGAKLDGFEVAGDFGTFDTRRGRISHGGSTESGLDWLVSATAFDSRGDDLFFPEYRSEPSGGVAHGRDGEHGAALFARATLDEFTLEAAFAQRTKEIPTGSYETLFDVPGNQSVDTQLYFDLRYEHALSDRWTVESNLYYDDYSYRGSYLYDASDDGGPADLVNDDRADGTGFGLDFLLSGTPAQAHRLLLGGEFGVDLRIAQSNRDVYYGLYSEDEREASRFGVFVQDEYHFAEDWRLSAGARVDRIQPFGATLSPRAALIWNPSDHSAWKLLYGRAFRAPNAYELYYDDGDVSQRANPDLDPELLDGFELVHEHRFGDSWRTSISLFSEQLRNLIVQELDADDLLIFRNGNRAYSRGVELEVEQSLDNGLHWLASYSFQAVRDSGLGRRPVNSPRHQALLAAEAPVVPDRLRIGLEVQFTGERRTLTDQTSDAFTLVNATLRTPESSSGLSAALTVHNVFAASYADPGGAELLQDQIEQDGRTLLLQVRQRF